MVNLSMHKTPASPSDIMVKGISLIGRSRRLKDSDKDRALKTLVEGVQCINSAIELAPNDIDLRLMRLTYFIGGVSLNSPITIVKNIEDDIDYFENSIDSLTSEQRIIFYEVIGEYYLELNHRDMAIEAFERCLSISPKASDFALATLNRIKTY